MFYIHVSGFKKTKVVLFVWRRVKIISGKCQGNSESKLTIQCLAQQSRTHKYINYHYDDLPEFFKDKNFNRKSSLKLKLPYPYKFCKTYKNRIYVHVLVVYKNDKCEGDQQMNI